VLIPKLRDKEILSRFMESVAQFERIVNDSDFIKLERLSEEDIIGTTSKQGLLEQYLSLSERGNTNAGYCFGRRRSSHRKQRLCLHTLSDTDDLPSSVSAETRYENCLPIEVTVFCLCCTSWIVVKLQSHLQPVSFFR
jgi:hypothetical protein